MSATEPGPSSDPSEPYVIHLPEPRPLCARREAIQQVAAMQCTLHEIYQEELALISRKFQVLSQLADKEIELERGYCQHQHQCQPNAQ